MSDHDYDDDIEFPPPIIRTRNPIWHDIADALVRHGLNDKPGPFVGIGNPTALLSGPKESPR